jgi:uncharacterized protein YjbI with pentapeptide repeats
MKKLFVILCILCAGSLVVFAKPEKSEVKDFSGQNLSGYNFAGQDLDKANFENANLTGANFRKAEVEEANFKNANLTDADFTGADLEEANLKGAIIKGATFKGAELEYAIWTDGKTCAAGSVGSCW